MSAGHPLRRERLRPTADGYDPGYWEVIGPYLPTKFGWETREEVLRFFLVG